MATNYAVASIGYDTTFELNEFNEPRIRSELETLKDVLLFVLFTKPGQYPSLPMIGMDLQNRLYEFYDELDVDHLKAEIAEQCSILGSYINGATIDIRKMIYHEQPSLLIHIEGNETFPANYKSDKVGKSGRYMIGITYNELKQMIYNVNT